MPECFFDELRHFNEFSDVTVTATIGAHNFFRYFSFWRKSKPVDVLYLMPLYKF